jgi:hypothetical protein
MSGRGRELVTPEKIKAYKQFCSGKFNSLSTQQLLFNKYTNEKICKEAHDYFKFFIKRGDDKEQTLEELEKLEKLAYQIAIFQNIYHGGKRRTRRHRRHHKHRHISLKRK